MVLGVVHGRRRRVVNRRDRSRRWIIHGRKRGLVIWAGEGRGRGWLANNRGRRLRIDYNRTRGSGICDGSLDKIKNALIFGKESHARSATGAVQYNHPTVSLHTYQCILQRSGMMVVVTRVGHSTTIAQSSTMSFRNGMNTATATPSI